MPGSSAKNFLEQTDDPVEKYRVIRDYIIHEDNLINQRMTWMILIQSFLVAGFVYSLSSGLDDKGGDSANIGSSIPMSDTLTAIVWAIPLTGLTISLLGFVSILAASNALTSLTRTYSPQFEEKGFPPLSGGGSGSAALLGFVAPFLIPVAMVVLWVLALGITVAVTL